MLIDSHAHLTCLAFENDLSSVLERAQMSGIVQILNISTTPDELQKSWEAAKRFTWILHAGATTPHDVIQWGERDFPFFAKAAHEKKIHAIGETGLDYYYEHSPKEVQKIFLRRYLDLAQACHLPIIVHCRDAFIDLFRILDLSGFCGKGILHCFTGTLQEAEEIISRQWYVSLSGIVTFKKSHALRVVAERIPADRLLIETDAPYLAPQSRRGQRNEPAFLPDTARLIAQIRGITFEELCRQTTENFKKAIIENQK